MPFWTQLLWTKPNEEGNCLSAICKCIKQPMIWESGLHNSPPTMRSYLGKRRIQLNVMSQNTIGKSPKLTKKQRKRNEKQKTQSKPEQEGKN